MALYILSDEVILSWAANTEMLSMFGECLSGLATQVKSATRKRGCRKCGGGVRTKITVSVDSVKRCLVNMTGEKRKALKAHLNATGIRFAYTRVRAGRHEQVIMTI